MQQIKTVEIVTWGLSNVNRTIYEVVHMQTIRVSKHFLTEHVLVHMWTSQVQRVNCIDMGKINLASYQNKLYDYLEPAEHFQFIPYYL